MAERAPTRSEFRTGYPQIVGLIATKTWQQNATLKNTATALLPPDELVEPQKELRQKNGGERVRAPRPLEKPM